MLVLNASRRRQEDPFAMTEPAKEFAREDWQTTDQSDGRVNPHARAGLFSTCANPDCRSGWLRVWRSRSTPVFESGWCCSMECAAAQVRLALRRELEQPTGSGQIHRHRIPLGLVMLEQGWITQIQLRRALESQAASGSGRLGRWLIHQEGVSEELVTRALGLQWSCPVLVPNLDELETFTPVLPRLFVDAFGALPLRIAAGRVLYLGFEGQLDPVFALAVERMTGFRVESGLVPESLFRTAFARVLEAKFPALELIEASSESALVRTLSLRVERTRPVESRLVRVHDCLWLRMWMRTKQDLIPDPRSIQDVVCSLRSN